MYEILNSVPTYGLVQKLTFGGMFLMLGFLGGILLFVMTSYKKVVVDLNLKERLGNDHFYVFLYLAGVLGVFLSAYFGSLWIHLVCWLAIVIVGIKAFNQSRAFDMQAEQTSSLEASKAAEWLGSIGFSIVVLTLTNFILWVIAFAIRVAG